MTAASVIRFSRWTHLRWSGSRFLLQRSIEFAYQSGRLEPHIDRSAQLGRHERADQTRAKPLSLGSGNRRPAHFAPDYVNAFRRIPKNRPFDLNLPNRTAQRAVLERVRTQFVKSKSVGESCTGSEFCVRAIEMDAVFDLHGLSDFKNELAQQWSIPMALRKDTVGLR